MLGELYVFHSLVSKICRLVGMTKECKRNVRGNIESLVRQKFIGVLIKSFPYQIMLATTGIHQN